MKLIHNSARTAGSVVRQVHCASREGNGLVSLSSAVGSSIRAFICTLHGTLSLSFWPAGCTVHGAVVCTRQRATVGGLA